MQNTFDSKIAIVLRGCPGSGKSTMAATLKALFEAAGKTAVHCEADQYLYTPEGVYDWSFDRVTHAHCMNEMEILRNLRSGVDCIIISDTNCKGKDLDHILELINFFQYKAVVMVVENRHGGKNIHGASAEKLKKMSSQLRGSLKLIPDDIEE